MSRSVIALRSIQHYLYCPHRWGLLEIDQAWAENLYITRANLMHERVHDPKSTRASRGKLVYTAVPIYHDGDAYDLYGVTDCLEATPSKNGVSLPGQTGKYQLCIVEYKPTKPKGAEYNESDLMQVFAQKLCVDYVFGGGCTGVIYYADQKKRVQLPLQENFTQYNQRLLQLLGEMREHLRNGTIPPIPPKQYCSGCSMKDVCLPSPRRKNDLRTTIHKLEAEWPCENY